MNISSIITSYIALGFAIASEVTGSAFLKKSEQFTQILPTGLMILFYVISFFFLSVALKSIPLGTTYAIWSGAGIVLTALVGLLVFKQPIDIPAMIGMAMIICGVVVLNLFSRTAGHV